MAGRLFRRPLSCSNRCWNPCRWGRTNEMLTGEDPTLGRQLSRAFTWGIQSNPTYSYHPQLPSRTT